MVVDRLGMFVQFLHLLLMVVFKSARICLRLVPRRKRESVREGPSIYRGLCLPYLVSCQYDLHYKM